MPSYLYAHRISSRVLVTYQVIRSSISACKLMITFFITGLKICLGNPLDDVLYNNLRKEVEALWDMLTKYQETTGVETKRICQTLDLFRREVHEAFIKLRDKQSCLEQGCLEMERGLKECLRSEMQKFEQRFSRFENSVHERIDGLDGKIAKLSERVERETAGTISNVQFGKESSSDLSCIRQFTQEEKHLQPNKELASATQSRELDQPLALDELDTVKKNKPKGRKKRNQAKS